MSELEFENKVRSLAQGMDYPPTPDVVSIVTARLHTSSRSLSKKLVWSLTVLLVLIASLMLIPSARAAILEFIQVGVVRIFRIQPTPLPPPNSQAPGTTAPGATPQPLIPILRDVSGEMTLEQA